jgi:hypothetical protein
MNLQFFNNPHPLGSDQFFEAVQKHRRHVAGNPPLCNKESNARQVSKRAVTSASLHPLLSRTSKVADGCPKHSRGAEAQGIALGLEFRDGSALKGGDNVFLCRPFRACDFAGLQNQGDAWAGMFRGFGP